MQLVDINYRANFVISLCLSESQKNRGINVGRLCEKVTKDMCDMNLKDICGIAKQDRVALSVASYLNMDKNESCDMHDGNKIGKCAIRNLTRSINKAVINPFDEGVKLSLKFQDVAENFKSTLENCENYKKAVNDDDSIPFCGIKRNLSGTRIQA